MKTLITIVCLLTGLSTLDAQEQVPERQYETQHGVFTVSGESKNQLKTPGGNTLSIAGRPIIDIRDYGKQTYIVETFAIRSYQPALDTADLEVNEETYLTLLPETYRAPAFHELKAALSWGKRRYYIISLCHRDDLGQKRWIYRGFVRCYAYPTHNSVQYRPFTKLADDKNTILSGVTANKEKLTLSFTIEGTGEPVIVTFTAEEDFLAPLTPAEIR